MNSFQVTPRRDLDSPKSSSLNEEFTGTQQSSATTSSGKETRLFINPNWNEGGHFPPLVFFYQILTPEFLLKKIPNFHRGEN